MSSREQLLQFSKYTILDRMCAAIRALKLEWRLGVFGSASNESRAWLGLPPQSRWDRFKRAYRHIKGAFTYTPAVTKEVRENFKQLDCNEKQLVMVARGELEWEEANCVLKHSDCATNIQNLLQSKLANRC